MDEEKVIKDIIDPILEQLEKVDGDQLHRNWTSIPQFRFVFENPSDKPLYIEGVEINEAFIRKLEKYLQNEIEMMNKPTIFH